MIGPNGAGKTTLFNLISGFQTPDEGRIVFDGKDITGRPPEQIAAAGLVRTFQLVQLFRESHRARERQGRLPSADQGRRLSALCAAAARGRTEREVEARARELLAFVGLDGARRRGRRARWPTASSGCSRSRARSRRSRSCSCSTSPRPGLTAEEIEAPLGAIRAIAEHGTTVLLIEHDMKLVMNTADTVAVLDFGRKIAEGTPAEVRENPAVIAAYLGAGRDA